MTLYYSQIFLRFNGKVKINEKILYYFKKHSKIESVKYNILSLGGVHVFFSKWATNSYSVALKLWNKKRELVWHLYGKISSYMLIWELLEVKFL